MSFRTVYGNEWSEAGWRMCNRDECVVANVLPFTNTAPIRAGDAATILNAWLIWYHHNVDALTSPVWGWSATNDVADSNHLAGVSVDINAPKYPWGMRTMRADLIAKTREGLRLFEGSVFWGADWSRADEMHFQIGWQEGDPRVHAFAEKLNNGHLGIYGPAPAMPNAPTPAPAPVVNRIAEMAERAPWLGAKLTPELEKTTPDGRGRYAAYEHGHIYYTPEYGARPIPAHLFESYAAFDWETGPLGYPVDYHKVLPEGDVQAFEGGGLYRKNGQPGFIVGGEILKRWAGLNFENGPYGWPTSNERDYDGGKVQSFENGDLYWHPSRVVGMLDEGKA